MRPTSTTRHLRTTGRALNSKCYTTTGRAPCQATHQVKNVTWRSMRQHLHRVTIKEQSKSYATAKFTAKAVAEQRLIADDLPRVVHDWARKHFSAMVGTREMTSEEAKAAIHMVISFVSVVGRVIWPKSVPHYLIRPVSDPQARKLISAKIPELNLDVMMELYHFLTRSPSTYTYDFAVELVVYMADGRSLLFTQLLLAYEIRNRKAGLENLKLLANAPEVAQQLKSGLNKRETSQPFDWVATALLGAFEELNGSFTEAMSLYNEAASLRQHVDNRNPYAQEYLKRLGELVGTIVPWQMGVDLILKSRSDPRITPEQRQELFENAGPLIQRGVEDNDARAYYLSSLPTVQNYMGLQTTKAYDETLNTTRPPRKHEDVGKPAAWLFAMTKAAATGQPDAQVELGEYYWTTPSRQLDDEPPDFLKPTLLDRWPRSDPGAKHYIVDRVLETLGLSGVLGRYKEGLEKDVFTTVTLPATAEDRARLALRWFKAAVDLRYAPAIRQVLDVLTSEYLPVDTSVPKQRALPFKDKLEYFDAIFRGQEQGSKQRSTEASSDREDVNKGESIRNPLYNPEAAKSYLAKAWYALRIRSAWKEYKSRYEPLHARHTVSSQAAFNNFRKEIEMKSKVSWQDLEPWLSYPDILELWENEVSELQLLYNTCKKLVVDNSWDIRSPKGALLWSHEALRNPAAGQA